MSTLLTVTRRFSAMQDEGYPVLRSLRTIHDELEDGTLKDAFTSIIVDIECGASVHEAFARQPQCFDREYVSIIKAGEYGGMLEVTLQRLVAHLEQLAKGELARTFRTLALLVSVGVPILECLKIVQEKCLDDRYQRLYQEVYQSIRGGGTIAEVFRGFGLPPKVVDLIMEGEEKGDLDPMLYKAADLCDTVDL